MNGRRRRGLPHAFRLGGFITGPRPQSPPRQAEVRPGTVGRRRGLRPDLTRSHGQAGADLGGQLLRQTEGGSGPDRRASHELAHRPCHPVSTGAGPPFALRRPTRRYPTTHLQRLAYLTIRFGGCPDDGRCCGCSEGTDWRSLTAGASRVHRERWPVGPGKCRILRVIRRKPTDSSAYRPTLHCLHDRVGVCNSWIGENGSSCAITYPFLADYRSPRTGRHTTREGVSRWSCSSSTRSSCHIWKSSVTAVC